jgi:hypothetical protein
VENLSYYRLLQGFPSPFMRWDLGKKGQMSSENVNLSSEICIEVKLIQIVLGFI